MTKKNSIKFRYIQSIVFSFFGFNFLCYFLIVSAMHCMNAIFLTLFVSIKIFIDSPFILCFHYSSSSRVWWIEWVWVCAWRHKCKFNKFLCVILLLLFFYVDHIGIDLHGYRSSFDGFIASSSSSPSSSSSCFSWPLLMLLL